jgi:hypothetical protein
LGEEVATPVDEVKLTGYYKLALMHHHYLAASTFTDCRMVILNGLKNDLN